MKRCYRLFALACLLICACRRETTAPVQPVQLQEALIGFPAAVDTALLRDASVTILAARVDLGHTRSTGSQRLSLYRIPTAAWMRGIAVRVALIYASVTALATAAAPRLTAQSVEVAVRIGHSAPTGSQFQLTNSIEAVRVWDNGGLSVGVSALHWVSGHFGVQGTADLQFTRHQGSWVYSGPCCIPMEPGPGTMDGNATNLVASLRLALRQGLGGRLQLGVSLGPALIRFGDAEQSQAPDYALAHRTTYGVAAGLSAACALSSRFRFSVGTDYVAFRVRPAAPSLMPGSWYTVAAPMQHQFTVSAMAAVTVS